MAGYRKPFMSGEYSDKNLSAYERKEAAQQRRDDDLAEAQDQAREATAVASLRVALATAGCTPEAIETLVLHRHSFWTLVERGTLRFTDMQKQATVEAAFSTFERAALGARP